MSRIRIETDIRAPLENCFDLARSVEAHIASTGDTGERAVAGVTRGLLALGDSVTWRARHLGINWELTSRITAFDRPRHFRDEMTRGVFTRLVHDHYFEPLPNGTRMVDEFDFTPPIGPLGTVADRLFLARYLRQFLETRARALKQFAESGDVGAWTR